MKFTFCWWIWKLFWIDWVLPNYEKTISNHQNGQSNSKPGRGGTGRVTNGRFAREKMWRTMWISDSLSSWRALESIPLEKVVPLLCYINGLLKNFRMANFNPFELRTGRNISKYITHANLHAKYSIHGAYRYDSTRLKSSDVNYNFWKKPWQSTTKKNLL